MFHISTLNFPDNHLISICFTIRLWGEYDPCMGLSMKVAHGEKPFPIILTYPTAGSPATIVVAWSE